MRRSRVLLAAAIAVGGGASVAATGSPSPAHASTTLSVSCSVRALLLPGKTTTCTTPVLSCPGGPFVAPFDANLCFYFGTTLAQATIGIGVGGTVTSTVNPIDSPPFVGVEAASCAKSGLTVQGGCQGQIPTGLPTQETFTDDPSVPGAITGSGRAVCVWAGGAVAVLATLTCTETISSVTPGVLTF